MRWLLLTILAMVAVACGGGGGETGPKEGESAENAMERQFGYLDKGQWGKQWEELHPGQQASVPKEKFISCRSDTSVDISSLEVLETYEEAIDIAGVPEKSSTAVTVKLKGNFGVFGTEEETTDTFHEILHDGAWRWVIPEEDVKAYRRGDCP